MDIETEKGHKAVTITMMVIITIIIAPRTKSPTMCQDAPHSYQQSQLAVRATS